MIRLFKITLTCWEVVITRSTFITFGTVEIIFTNTFVIHSTNRPFFITIWKMKRIMAGSTKHDNLGPQKTKAKQILMNNLTKRWVKQDRIFYKYYHLKVVDNSHILYQGNRYRNYPHHKLGPLGNHHPCHNLLHQCCTFLLLNSIGDLCWKQYTSGLKVFKTYVHSSKMSFILDEMT